MEKENKTEDPEIIAISKVYYALKDLDLGARKRVLNYVSSKFNIHPPETKIVEGSSVDLREQFSPFIGSRKVYKR
jgi:hypothetical protein